MDLRIIAGSAWDGGGKQKRETLQNGKCRPFSKDGPKRKTVRMGGAVKYNYLCFFFLDHVEWKIDLVPAVH